ncbi:hypothetical protein ACFO0A_08815 [Novosphingobium tardum]|uniref:Tetratricopeptide repeat protein n=1 Tax=Novosphingobium tardum TaxID=1538021 RepID=A0ABV8RSD8_9SPHN
MGKFSFTSGRITLGVVLAAGVAVAGAAVPAQAKTEKPKPEAKAAGKFSKEFAAAAQPLQIALDKAKVAKAKGPAGQAELDAALAGTAAMMAAAEAAIQTPTDRLVAGQFAINLGGYNNDIKLRQRGAQYIVDSGQIGADKLPEFQYYLGNFAYANKDYAAAKTALAAAVAGKYPSDDAVELLADSYVKAGDPAGGLAQIRSAVDARRAAGQTVPNNWLKRANLIAYNAKLGPQAMDWAMTQVELYPTAFNWLGSTQLVRRFANYGPQENVDLFRLMQRTGAFNNDAQYVQGEYKEYVEALDARRLPGEVLKILDSGIAAGKLSASAPWVSEARATANGRISSDKASLGGQVASAKASPNGTAALSLADAYLNYSNAAQAESLYQAAIAKGGIDKDRAYTRLGIAQVDQGKWAAAKDSFSKVGGTRLPLAKMWLIYVNQKMAGAAG